MKLKLWDQTINSLSPVPPSLYLHAPFLPFIFYISPSPHCVSSLHLFLTWSVVLPYFSHTFLFYTTYFIPPFSPLHPSFSTFLHLFLYPPSWCTGIVLGLILMTLDTREHTHCDSKYTSQSAYDSGPTGKLEGIFRCAWIVCSCFIDFFFPLNLAHVFE